MSYLTRGRASKTLKLAKGRRAKEGKKVRKVRDYVKSREGRLKGNCRCFGMQPERFVTITTIHHAAAVRVALLFSDTCKNREI